MVKSAFPRVKIVAAVAAMLLFCGSAHAQERKAYKHVDKNGNITYSQTPPADGKEAKKVDIAPAHRGRGGSPGGSDSYYDDPRAYSSRYGSRSYGDAPVTSVQQRPSAHEQRLATLKAECERNRGTDCNNPAALQYQDSTSIPGGRRYR